MTIQKVYTSQNYKNSNKNILGKSFINKNELIEKNKNSGLRSINNPIIFNKCREPIFKKTSFESVKNNLYADFDERNSLIEENEKVVNSLSNRVKECYINNNILNKFEKENGKLEFFKGKDHINSEVENLNKNDFIKNDFIERRKIISDKEIVNVKNLE